MYKIVQLLERGSISGDMEGHTKLLEIVAPPVSQYLPKDAKRIGKLNEKELFEGNKNIKSIA